MGKAFCIVCGELKDDERDFYWKKRVNTLYRDRTCTECRAKMVARWRKTKTRMCTRCYVHRPPTQFYTQTKGRSPNICMYCYQYVQVKLNGFSHRRSQTELCAPRKIRTKAKQKLDRLRVAK